MSKIILVILFIFSLLIAGFLVVDFVSLEEQPKEIQRTQEIRPMFKTQEEMYEHKIEMLEKEIAFRNEMIEELKEDKSQLEKIQNLLLGLSALILNVFSIVGMVKKWKPKK